jgi:hypothetical protein
MVIPEINSIGSVSEKTKDFLNKLLFTRLLHTVSEIRVATYRGESSRAASLGPARFCGYPKDHRVKLQTDLDLTLWSNL